MNSSIHGSCSTKTSLVVEGAIEAVKISLSQWNDEVYCGSSSVDVSLGL